MRLVTWNVNGIRSAHSKGLQQVFQDLRPDEKRHDKSEDLHDDRPKHERSHDLLLHRSRIIRLQPIKKDETGDQAGGDTKHPAKAQFLRNLQITHGANHEG